MFDCCYYIYSNKWSLKFAKNVALYFVTVWQSTTECTFSLISGCLVRDHQAIQDGCHHQIQPQCFRKLSILRQDGCTVSVLVQTICKFFSKKEIGIPFYTIISMQNKPNPFLCHPAILDCRKLATCFLLPLFYSQFDIMKYINIIALTTWAQLFKASLA